MDAPPITLKVIDGKPCRWVVDMTGRNTVKQNTILTDNDKGQVTTVHSSTTWNYWLAGTQIGEGSFESLISTKETGVDLGSAMTYITAPRRETHAERDRRSSMK